MKYSLLIIISMDSTVGGGGTALNSHIVEFETLELADQAYHNITQHDDAGESYTQVEAVKLYDSQ